jgi:hypothetical protein
MPSLCDAVFVQVLDRTGPLMPNLSGTPYIYDDNDGLSTWQNEAEARDERSGTLANGLLTHDRTTGTGKGAMSGMRRKEAEYRGC